MLSRKHPAYLGLILGLGGLMCGRVWADVTLLDSQVVHEDVFKRKNEMFQDGKYILPNERSTRLFEPALQGLKGACISVGSFRSFNLLALSHCSLLVTLDVNGMIVRFNRVNAGLIAKAKDVDEYVSVLSGRGDRSQIPVDLKTGFNQILNDAQIDPAEFFDRLKQGYSEIDWEASAYGSKEKFDRVQELSLKNRVVAAHGSIFGKRTLTSLGAALKNLGIPVSVLDISNILDYRYVTDGKGISEKKRNHAQFLKNLKALPFEKNAIVLMTTLDQVSLRKSDAMFSYIAWPVSDFVKTIESESFRREASRIHDRIREAGTYITARGEGGLIVPTFDDRLLELVRPCRPGTISNILRNRLLRDRD